jgi:serine/threonine-protein kinase
MSTRADEIFIAALELQPDEREPYLQTACQGDSMLLEEVRGLLQASCEPDSFLKTGGARQGAVWQAMVTETEVPESPKGFRIGQYRLIHELGRGGMAVVYLAERADGQFEQQVALKLVKIGSESEEMRRRFTQERQILASLSHPGIARMLDGGLSEEGRPYFVIEHIDGLPVDRYCDQHRLTIEERLRYFVAVADAVQYAHRNLIVHRDLKPRNILVDSDGQVKLLDFGIAKILDEGREAHKAPPTRTGVYPMTPEYAAPEQIRGEAISTATDVYQLGVLLYELLTGRRPYRLGERSPSELERIICERDVPAPSIAVSAGSEEQPPGQPDQGRREPPQQLAKRLRGDLDTIVLKALRKEPERRYASVEQLRLDIERYLSGQPVTAQKDTLRYRARKFLKRHTRAVAAALIVVMLIAGLTVVYTIGLSRERDRAQREAGKANQVATFLKELFVVSDPWHQSWEEVSARELLDRGAERVSSDLAEQPEMRAEMMFVLGDIYRKLGAYDRAQPLLEEVLEVHREVYHDRPARLASSVNAVANLYLEQGKYDESELLYQQALEMVRDRLGADHLDVAMGCSNLAVLHVRQGRYEEAESLFENALAIRESKLESHHPEVAANLNNLAGLLFLQGRYGEAGPLFERVTEIRRMNLGEDHPEVADSLSNLAAVYNQTGRLVEAESCFREALAVQERALGAEHPRVASTLNNLAGLYGSQGRIAEAEDLFRRSLEIREQVLGARHPQLASSIGNLALLCSMQGRYGEAETLYKRALSILEESVGPRHPAVTGVLRNIGLASLEQGRFRQAETYLARSLAISEETLGERHPKTGESLQGLGALYLEQERGAEAEDYLRRAGNVFRSTVGESHLLTATNLVSLARLATQQGNLSEADEHLRQAIKIAGPPEDGPQDIEREVVRATALVALGTVQQRLGDSEQAEASWQEAVEIMQGLHGGKTDSEIVVQHLDIHVKALLSLGRAEEAADLVDQLLATGWSSRELIGLCRQQGVLTE